MKCERCAAEHDGSYATGRFCNRKCANSFSTLAKRKEINIKVSNTLIGKPTGYRNNVSNGKKRYITSCNYCGMEFSTVPSRPQKFCSRKCWIESIEQTKTERELYSKKCSFDFNITEHCDKFDMSPVKQYGWYSPSNKGNNLSGISKDHMFSIADGFKYNIDPNIIKHPANCMLLPHRENQKKRHNSSITIEELLDRIRCW